MCTFAEWFGEDLTGQHYMGSIICSNNNLTSLKGAPQSVQGNFVCSNNNLTSLEHLPYIEMNLLLSDFNESEVKAYYMENMPEMSI
ncbi:hypothetical protein [Vibrio phage phiKT1024]|nr:hypothetical protein [Vibrio phage phiKT1024]